MTYSTPPKITKKIGRESFNRLSSSLATWLLFI